MIPFNAPPVVGTELDYMQSAMNSGKLCGDGGFTRRCQQWFEQRFGTAKALLTPSCTASLEMAALLLDIQPGDEVIMPSYTFVSTANAFVLRGAKIVFVDIRRDTMNIDESLIEAAITDKTRAIVPVHYAGVACEMDTIMALAAKYNLYVVEDAAQGVMSTYKGRALGTIGHIGCFSFHETKNYTAGGEGGATLINDRKLVERAEIIREKGTNRSQFFRGLVDKYTWRDIGSSYLMSDLQAAYLWAQLEAADRINQQRLALWQNYYDALEPLAVEAARAGEQGRGFAVVAGEVRNLAKRSASAASEIRHLIEASVLKVESGAGQVHQAGQTIADIVEKVQNVTDLLQQISTATREQGTGLSEVGKAVEELDRITHHNASLVEEGAQASARMKDQARLLVDAVNVFR